VVFLHPRSESGEWRVLGRRGREFTRGRYKTRCQFGSELEARRALLFAPVCAGSEVTLGRSLEIDCVTSFLDSIGGSAAPHRLLSGGSFTCESYNTETEGD
jgi:hypothetical protein